MPHTGALEVKSAQSLLKAAGATVSMSIHDADGPMLNSPLREVLRASVTAILEYPGTPDVNITVDAGRMNIHSVSSTIVSAPALQRLSRLKEVLARRGIQLITKHGEDEFTLSATVVGL